MEGDKDGIRVLYPSYGKRKKHQNGRKDKAIRDKPETDGIYPPLA